MYIALVQGSCDDEHHIVNHVAVSAVIQKLCERFIRLQQHEQMSDTTLNSAIRKEGGTKPTVQAQYGTPCMGLMCHGETRV